MTDDVVIRRAGTADADLIAEIHAASWRSAYRGIVSDDYLAGPVVEERLAFWRRRMSEDDRLVVLLAYTGGKAGGFIAWVGDADPQWGGIIDNFHMLPEMKGKGAGRKLFEAVRQLSQAHDPHQGLFLWVLEPNIAARQVYQRLGGTEADRMERQTGDGQHVPAVRVIWRPHIAAAASER